MTNMTVHGVLAGAYRGNRKDLAVLLTHASADGGSTAVCGVIRPGNLCDIKLPGPPTCKRCARRWWRYATAVWEQTDVDAARATGHAMGCDCTTCCLIRTESSRAQGVS